MKISRIYFLWYIFLNYTLYLDLYVCWHASFSYIVQFLVVIFRLSSFMGEAMSQLLTSCLFLADAVRQTLFCWVVHLFDFLYVLMFVCLCSSFFTVVCRSVFYKPFLHMYIYSFIDFYHLVYTKIHWRNSTRASVNNVNTKHIYAQVHV